MSLAVACGLLAGVLAALGAWSEGLHHWPLPGLCLITLLALGLAWRERWRPLAGCCAGLVLAGGALRDYQQRLLPAGFDERALVEARVAGIPEQLGGDLRFTALVTSLRIGSALHPGTRATLRWSGGPIVHAGETWQLLVALHAPQATSNPGSGDSALLALRLRQHAAGQVLASPLDLRLHAASLSLDRLRERLGAWLRARVPERDAAALLVALAVGDTQHVSQEQWRVFNAVGITHLVAISGLHVTLFSLVAGWCAAAAWGRWPALRSRLPRSSFASAVGVLAATGYALLAGLSVPTQRTLLMLACWHGLAMAARPRRAATSLAAGLAGVLLLDPLSPLAPGFWLSFLAVGALLLGGALGMAPGGGWRGMLREQAWVGVALLPVTVAVFGSVSLAGLVVNLAAIPFFSFLLVPLVLAASACVPLLPALATLLLHLAAACAQAAWPLLEWAASAPHSLWRVAPGSGWYLLAAAALAVALLPWPAWMRASAALALLPLAAPGRVPLAAGEFAATVFDLGSGEATLLRTAHHALLYDDGEVHGSAGSSTARVLVPALRHYGLAHLDRVLLPRLDVDRGAGVAALDAALAEPPGLWAAPRAARRGDANDAAGELPQEFLPCQAGLRWQWDGVDFQVLAGEACSLRVASGAAALLLPGPANAAMQRARLAPQLPPTPVLLLPAQGARGAWAPALAAAARAQWVLLAGTSRAAQRPAQAAALAAWCAAGALALVTGDTGAIEIAFARDGPIRIATRRRPSVSCPIEGAAE